MNNLHIRHDLKTSLNHIVGYCEILIEDAREYRRADLVPGIEQILAWAEKLKRLIHFYYDKAGEAPSVSADEIKRAFYMPLMQVITDSRRLIVLFRQKAPGFVKDMEQLLSVSTQMYELIERQVIDLELASTSLESSRATPQPTADMPSFDDLDYTDTLEGERTVSPASILVIDDSPVSQTLIARHLKALGHQISLASSGEEALTMLLGGHEADIIILDVLMPGMSGVHILKALKDHRKLREIPVIMMSMVDNSANIAQCIKLGAEDYLPKDFDPIILRARIDACLEKNRLHRQQEVFIRALLESQQTLANELADAARYVVSLLPPPLESPLQTAIALQPSAELGGDFCSHHWLDDDHLCMYLLDVSGHGIKSALLAVSIANLLRNRGLPDLDFRRPAEVLDALNKRYQADGSSTIFFTIWYGIYNLRTRELHYAAGGSPPGVLVRNGEAERLHSGELLLGASEDAVYTAHHIKVQAQDRLFLFSDGIFEINRTNNKIFGLDEFIKLLPHQQGNPARDIDDLLNTILALTMNERFPDDVCVFEALFS